MRQGDADRNANETQEALGVRGGGLFASALRARESKQVRQSADGNAIRATDLSPLWILSRFYF